MMAGVVGILLHLVLTECNDFSILSSQFLLFDEGMAKGI